MMIGTVFRIEHEETGRGCYVDRYGTSTIFLDNMLERHNASSLHPSSDVDLGICRSVKLGTEFCGFKDMKQLYGWFTSEELWELENTGYHIIKIEGVEITAIGNKQVLFLKPAEKICKNSENLLDIAF